MKALETKLLQQADIKAALGQLPTPSISSSSGPSAAQPGLHLENKDSKNGLTGLLAQLALANGAGQLAAALQHLAEAKSAPGGGWHGSGQDEDDDSDGDNKHSDEVPGTFARMMVKNVQSFGSFSAWFRVQEWNHVRNKNECQHRAQAADALLDENVDIKSVGLEIILRRLAGVQLADSMNNWNAASAIQYEGSASTLLSRSELGKAIKEAAQRQRLEQRLGQQNEGFRGTKAAMRAKTARSPVSRLLHLWI